MLPPEGTGALKYPVRSGSQGVECRCYDGSNDDPEQLEPVEEWNAYELWLVKVVKRRIEQDYEGDEQEEQEPGTTPSFGTRTGNHNFSPFVSWNARSDTDVMRRNDR